MRESRMRLEPCLFSGANDYMLWVLVNRQIEDLADKESRLLERAKLLQRVKFLILALAYCGYCVFDGFVTLVKKKGDH